MKSRQRGAALLSAMLTVTLVATFAASALWQQWRAVEVESAERTRVQAAWILIGALDWSRLVLREDSRGRNATDHLAEPWALPLQEARLSSFLAADASGTVTTSAADLTAEAEDAFLSGQIIDLQSRLNVLALIGEGGKSSPVGQAAFEKLFTLLALPSGELQALARNLIAALDPADEGAPLMPQRFEQLTWLGLSPDTVAALAPHATLLPSPTRVNLNTASAEALYAVVPSFTLATAQQLVDLRAQSPLASIEDATRRLGPIATGAFNDAQVGTSSQYFEVRGRLRLGITALEERSLVMRDGNEARTVWRERGALGPTPTSAAVQR